MNSIIISMEKKLKKIYDLSIENYIPILRNNTLKHLISFIKDNDIVDILEIGTGYGFSSYAIYKSVPSVKIITLEKDTSRYNVAKKNIKDENINILNVDCFEYIPVKKFDLVIIDGPKRNQILLFEKFEKFVKENGTIFIDNLNILTLKKKDNLTNSQKKIIESVDQFKKYIICLKNYQKTIYEIDDGFCFLKKEK